MKIAVDIDEVLSEFVAEFFKWYNREYDTQWAWEDVTDYHWPNFLGNTSKEAIDDVHRFFETERFRNLPLVTGAKEGIATLAAEHELYAVTGRQNVTRDITCDWLNRNFPDVFRTVEFTNNYPKDGSPTLTKGEVCSRLGCELLIDDDTRHVEPILEHNIKLVVFNKPWNSHHRLPPQILRANTWPEIIESINKLAARE